MSYFLEVNFYNITRRWTYDTFEEAKEQLDLLSPKLGKDIYERNKEGEGKTHTIKSKCGDGVVVLQHISCAGIVIGEEWKKAQDKIDSENMERALRWKAAGLEVK